VHPIDQPPVVVKPPVTQPPVTQPPVTQPPVTPPRPAHEPPREHHEHRDYIYVDGYDWWPRWYSYWDPYWYWAWQYLFDYYGGATDPEYAEWARDAYLRSIAPQWGWF
jgi:hypothetical protein